MKNTLFTKSVFIASLILSIFTVLSCSDDNIQQDHTPSDTNTEIPVLTEFDKEALLFMLEEEKLARDTYLYLYELWSINQFANIKNSEQMHMDGIENLLIQYHIDYTIRDFGVFTDENLQNFYNQFAQDGALSQTNALQIGATIEDLDIVDLENYIEAITNSDIILVFESLQCGSRNHLRSFSSAIEANGETYSPQYLTESEYAEIINASHEQCN